MTRLEAPVYTHDVSGFYHGDNKHNVMTSFEWRTIIRCYDERMHSVIIGYEDPSYQLDLDYRELILVETEERYINITKRTVRRNVQNEIAKTALNSKIRSE